MKKIMIALLAIAVLFGFAACDNSNTTTPGGEAGAVTDGTIATAANLVASLFDGTGVVSLVDDGAVVANYADGTLSYTVTKDDFNDAIEGPGMIDTSVTVTVSGEVVSTTGNATSGTKTITLGKYVYDFTTNGSDSVGNFQELSGSITGALVGGTIKVTISNGEVTNVEVDAATTTVLLPQDESGYDITLGKTQIGDKVFASWMNNATYGTSKAKVYATYVSEQETKYEGQIKTFTDTLLSDATASLASSLVNVFKASNPTSIAETTAVSSYNAETGTATLELSVESDAAIADVGEITIGSAGKVKVAPGTTLRVVLTPKAPAENETPDYSSKISAVNYTINGTLMITTAVGSEEFTEVTISNLAGTMDATDVTKSATGCTIADTFKLTSSGAMAYTSGIVSAPCAVGPALDGKGAIALTSVDKDFTPEPQA